MSCVREDKKDTRWISAFVEARPSEDYPPHWYFEDVQFLVSLINFQDGAGRGRGPGPLQKKSLLKPKHLYDPLRPRRHTSASHSRGHTRRSRRVAWHGESAMQGTQHGVRDMQRSHRPHASAGHGVPATKSLLCCAYVMLHPIGVTRSIRCQDSDGQLSPRRCHRSPRRSPRRSVVPKSIAYSSVGWLPCVAARITTVDGQNPA